MRNAERGVAVVMAMAVVALATMAATGILVSQSAWSRRAELGADHAQAQALVAAGVDWTRAVLSDDQRTSSVDHLGEPWALRLPPMQVENAELFGQIDDQQGAFNLNNLTREGKVSVEQLARFSRLLALLGLPPVLADALADWIDADSEPFSHAGAEDAYYLAQVPAYLPANRPLVDTGELALIRGFDTNVRVRLAQFVTALPVPTPVNVNTAPAEVLAAVVEGLDLAAARELVAQRKRAYFRDRADFLNRLPAGAKVAEADVSVGSDYFLATLRVTVGGAEARGKALLERRTAGRWPEIVWRKSL